MSYSLKVKNEIEFLNDVVLKLLDAVRIVPVDPNRGNNSGFFIVTTIHSAWRDGDDVFLVRDTQKKSLIAFNNVENGLAGLMTNEVESSKKDLKESLKKIKRIIDLKSDALMPSSISQAKTLLNTDIQKIRDFISRLERFAGKEKFILIPDTNVLINASDPSLYQNLANGAPFFFLLTAPVLRELDNQKNSDKKSVEYREKVKGAIRRIKGFRNQGDISSGVTVNRNITVLMDYKEPDKSVLPDWLDLNNNDDQIIAKALAIQFEHPTSKVIIVTEDMNLQNKASGARLSFAELSD